MGVLQNIVLGIAAISFITFVALFGQLPALRKSPIGWLQRILCLHIPNGLRKADQVATGGKIGFRSKRLGQYLFYEKNPFVLVSPLRRSFLWCTGLIEDTDYLPVSPDRLSNTLPLVRLAGVANKSHHTHTISGSPAFHLHLPLRHPPGSPHQAFKSPCQAERLSFRLHALLSAQHLQYLSLRETSQV